jgi:hypothetical protein
MTTPLDRVREQYRSRIRRLDQLPDIGMQAAALREAITERTPHQAIVWLDELVRGAIWGHEPEMSVVVALAHWLIERDRDDEDYSFFEAVYRTCHEHDIQTILFLLRDAPPHQELPDASDLPDVRLPLDRENITVGERRTLARGSDRDVLDRLVMDPDPKVIDVLLSNPSITQTEVLRIASRRPTTPSHLRTLVGHLRWLQRPEVRKAVLMNPYAPTGISLKLLPTLGIHELRRASFGSDLHPMVIESAEILVDLRETRTYPWEV